ncbi:DUF1800 domain-containing protein [Pontibacter ramchanderi]|uniref:Uncharacterized protein (DUF1800 family) n=1 Tax=Pontibacter ramchanderi TaxID=1179743 RepID=A0A2N3V375_9BACT|nr:DUF1800 domain-containing protein [Pontibacter ramchanderi]PKV76068.1 uncharacterized protein (DUF1800 family) [Pontibacter ramchanderi]
MKTLAREQKLQHLYWRAGFGIPFRNDQARSGIKSAVRELFKSSGQAAPLQVALPHTETTGQADAQNADMRQKRQRERQQGFVLLNNAWLTQMATSQAQLREKMTLFWHGHFACRLREPRFALLQHNTLRQHALGKFPDLLLAISKDPGMLQFLNNQQNRKQRPNENFARELLELFTLGRGHYTEQDIKEAARAFTGWSYNPQGEFVFRARQHDRGQKTFMGKRGNFNGEEILQMIVENPRTAEFLTSKLYAFFVSEVPNPERIKALSSYFYETGYDIPKLLEKIFTAKWFYGTDVVGSKIKSPIELLAGLQRQFDVRYTDSRSPLVLQRALGQELFRPTNVSGWAGGRNWIDSSTLAFRLRIGPALLQDAALEVNLKPDDDTEPTAPRKRRQDGLRTVRAKASLSGLHQQLQNVKDRELIEKLSQKLLQVPLQPETAALLTQHIPAGATHDDKVTLLTLRLLSLPEYQLC